MINVLVNGVNGRMGQEVVNQIKKSDNFCIICGVDKSDLGDNSFPVYTTIKDIIEIPDVIIDFSIPEASLNILEYALIKNIPIVIATTGFSNEQLNIIKNYSNKIPVFKAANMSYESNIMGDIVSKLSTLLKDSDIEIVETHHNNKIDAPSGTALFLADKINSSLNNKMIYEYDRHFKKQKRDKKEIGIHSIRGGSEVGKHTVYFFGDNESFEITHTINSRSILANGSLKAAQFIINQNAGLYSMSNLIQS